MACIDVNPKRGSTDKGKGFKERIIPSEGVLHSRKRRQKIYMVAGAKFSLQS